MKIRQVVKAAFSKQYRGKSKIKLLAEIVRKNDEIARLKAVLDDVQPKDMVIRLRPEINSEATFAVNVKRTK